MEGFFATYTFEPPQMMPVKGVKAEGRICSISLSLGAKLQKRLCSRFIFGRDKCLQFLR